MEPAAEVSAVPLVGTGTRGPSVAAGRGSDHWAYRQGPRVTFDSIRLQPTTGKTALPTCGWEFPIGNVKTLLSICAWMNPRMQNPRI